MRYLIIWLSLFVLYTTVYILFPVNQAVIISGILLFLLICGAALYQMFAPLPKSQFDTTPEEQALIEYQKALEKSNNEN